MSVRTRQGGGWLSAASACVIAMLSFGATGLAQMPAATRDTDVTEKVENLGNPFSKIHGSGGQALWRGLIRIPRPKGEWIYARNIWDMHVFEGRIYLGAGNYDNSAPAANAGPVPIVCYDPVRKGFVKEGTVDDEQIDVYHTHEGRLYIPGCDPMQSWCLGNFYRRQDNGRWKKHRNIPGTVHMFAMASSLEKGHPLVRRILLPDGNRPLDWVAYDNHVYVLTMAEAADGATVRVFRFHQEDLSGQEEVLHFRAPTFARSFKILDGDFYFGLGCRVDPSHKWDRKELPPATGEILRVKAEFVK